MYIKLRKVFVHTLLNHPVVKAYQNKPALLSLYYAFFHSQLYYGLLNWSSTFHSYYNKITILQNKAIKLVCGGKYSDRATAYYSKLKALKLPGVIQLEISNFCFQV